MKRFRVVSIILVLFIALGSIQGSVGAASQQTYIVLLTDAPLARYGGGIAGLAATDPQVTGASRLDSDSPASQAYRTYLRRAQDDFIALASTRLGRQVEVVQRYDTVLNGLALKLSAEEAQTVAGLPGVTHLQADEERELLTDAGPEWIGAPSVWDGSQSGGTATKGEGVIVGIIDTGVNHDHPSFADVGGDGYDHTNPRGQFYGACDPITGAPFCNDKLIGFYDFTGTTPEDTNQHGSHTASTTAGNVVDAELAAPTVTFTKRISGVAPHANVISYKVCITTCPLSAILGAVNQAALDEVDVVNFSIGGGASNPWEDLDARAFLNAHNAGVFSAVSAGNSGPGASTIGSPADAPWVFTVGASTHNRKFVNTLTNMTGGGTTPPAAIAGKSVTSGYGPAKIVYAGNYGDSLCQTPFRAGTFKGEIVVCDRGVNPRVEKASNVKSGGAGGFVLANDAASGDSTVGDPYALPGLNISHKDGVALKSWLASGAGHQASITGTEMQVADANGDIMAGFSSRGPNPSSHALLKPDVTAPGVDILAAVNTVNPTARPEYGVLSGTSMSSPHAAGAAALVRALHPEWTPDQVKSALMTTARTMGVRKEDGATAADPFDYGAGRIDLTRAGRAELVLNETASNYDAANPGIGGDPSTLNLPSLASGSCLGQCSWTRTVTNVSSVKARWEAAVLAPAGVAVSVTPRRFQLAPGQSQTLTIVADVSAVTKDGWKFGQLVLTRNGRQNTTAPETRLTMAINAVGGSARSETFFFHGNVNDGCSGTGALDLGGCGGPFLKADQVLDSNTAAAFGPVSVLLDCNPGVRCMADPSWIWNLDTPTTVGGPMTVAWWVASPATSLLFYDDYFIQVWADGKLVTEQRVRHTINAPGVPARLQSTIAVPEVTASQNILLVVDPIYITQDQSVFYYDSTQACPGATAGTCDSQVQMPVINR